MRGWSVPSAALFFLFFFVSNVSSPPPQYSLSKDVVSTLKKHRMHKQQFTHHPLLVLNNFGSDGMQIKLMATMFQNMFPSINVHKVGRPSAPPPLSWLLARRSRCDDGIVF